METGKTAGMNSVVSKKVTIEGDIRGDEDLRVEGRIKGSIKVAGDLVVTPSGVVEADVEADNVVIQGRLTGNVLAREQLEIRSSGQLLGDCRAKSIDIREGAVFEGRSSMLRSPAGLPAAHTGSSMSAGVGPKINLK